MNILAKPQSESAALQAIWRLAYRNGQHTIDLKTEAECRRVRFALYNAIRPIRTGKLVDEELSAAAEECAVRTEGTTLIVQVKTQTPAMLAVMESLRGVGEELFVPAETQEQAAMRESQRKLAALLAEGGGGAQEGQVSAGPAGRSTPYYTR